MSTKKQADWEQTLARSYVPPPGMNDVGVIQALADTSGSMASENKIDAATQGIRDGLQLMAEPAFEGALRVSLITFDSSAAVCLPLGNPVDHLPHMPALQAGGGTNIPAAFRVAIEQAQRLPAELQDNVSLHHVALLFSDGVSSGDSVAAAERFKQELGGTVVCIAFGSDADLGVLEKVASTPQLVFRAASPEALRALLTKLIRVISTTTSAGGDVAAVLSQNAQNA